MIEEEEKKRKSKEGERKTRPNLVRSVAKEQAQEMVSLLCHQPLSPPTTSTCLDVGGTNYITKSGIITFPAITTGKEIDSMLQR